MHINIRHIVYRSICNLSQNVTFLNSLIVKRIMQCGFMHFKLKLMVVEFNMVSTVSGLLKEIFGNYHTLYKMS